MKPLRSLLASLALLVPPLASHAQDAGYYAQSTYTSTGGTTYSIPFPYIQTTDLIVSINGAVQLPGYYFFPTTGSLQFYSAPASGAVVQIKRRTSIQLPNSTYRGGALSSAALNLNNAQDLYGIQETRDILQSVAAGGISGTYPTYPIVVTGSDGAVIYMSQSALPGDATKGPYHGNVAMGSLILNPTTLGTYTTACTNTTLPDCGDDTAFGSETLTLAKWGHDNSAFGTSALYNLVNGVSNTFGGSASGTNLIDAVGATGFGVSACQNIMHTNGPIQCFGQSALQSAITYGTIGGYDSAFGSDAMFSATTANYSAAFGDAAAFSATTVNYSLILGVDACHSVTSLVNTVCIGPFAGPTSGTLSGVLWIGGQNATTPTIWAQWSNNQVVLNGLTPVAGAELTVNGGVATTGYVRPGQTTYASLSTADASPQVGDLLDITDASACTVNTAVTAGGGSVHSCLTTYNGSGWVAVVTH